MDKQEYQKYLHSAHWTEFKHVYYKTHTACRECKSKHKLNIHHVTYANLWNETTRDVVCLCHKCHQKIHFEGLKLNLKRSEYNVPKELLRDHPNAPVFHQLLSLFRQDKYQTFIDVSQGIEPDDFPEQHYKHLMELRKLVHKRRKAQ